MRKPLIGICAGFNNILRALGTDVIEDKTQKHKIAPKENVECYAKISSISYDGLVESFELDNKKFIIGIKWHPELMMEDEFTKNLFREFIEKYK